MKKLLSLLIIGLSICLNSVNAQGIGINSSGTNPDPSAILDVSSTTKGTLITRMTTAQRDAIASPAEALQIFNTTTKCLEVYINNAWQIITCACVSAPATPGTITGSTALCTNATATYYIGAVTGAISYTWVVPGGTIITAGQGTASITVTIGSSSGNITVAVSNSCGMSAASSLAITVSPAMVILNPPSSYNGRQVFNYTGGNQTFNVTGCITKIFVKMWGAGGGGGGLFTSDGNTGGSGAFVSGFLNVAPGSTLTIVVGGGIHATSSNNPSVGGFGGGGGSGKSSPWTNGNTYYTGSGGGRSAIQKVVGIDSVTAGGGGGGAASNNSFYAFGGGGGAPTGADGGDQVLGPGGIGAGKGGTTSTGGAATIVTGTAVNSFAASSSINTYSGSAGATAVLAGGGGGGGYFGGSGGCGNSSNTGSVGGGGGGSSFTNALTNVTNISGNMGSLNTAWPAPNNTDVDYVSGIGVGAGSATNGGNGLVVIYW